MKENGISFVIKYPEGDVFAAPRPLPTGKGIQRTGICAEAFGFKTRHRAEAFCEGNVDNFPDLDNVQIIRIIEHNPLDVV
ncbi:hypothetical protein CH11_gp55 [Acinetobacter phage IMEAB3]|uniref:Uncharacterized protein n=1 Tax=Acinetobacter phage IMEAB3 TaxID=1458669 RepID=W6B0X6_9CAUD|nr:hypothetical protein CH11_gp55 [Acinetobacter phage IMEAB3]AHI60054.1 hypothetical protein IME_AB3_55 [Acinetobacter phage IMEAB3]